MAGTVKGISVKIGGDTTGLNKALADTTAKTKAIQSELKKVNEALKLDPQNVVMMAQKEELLNEAIAQTTLRLDALTKAESDVKSGFDAGKIGADQFRDFQRELETARAKMKALEAEKAGLAQVGKEMNSAASGAKDFATSSGSAANATQKLGEQVKRTSAETDKYEDNIKQATTAAKQLGDSGKQAFFTIENAIKGVILGYSGKKLIDFFITSNAEMEQYRVNFSTMLGDEQKAQALVDELTEMASKTPLTLPDVTGAADMLMKYGVAADDVIMRLTMLGDAAGGNAEKLDRVSLAYGQMLAKGKVTGEELRQLTEAGVPMLQQLADVMGVTTAEISKMVSNGEVGIPQLNAAFEALTSNGGKLDGMMEKQSQTMNGMLSTLKDELESFGRTAGKEAFESIETELGKLLAKIQELEENGKLEQYAEEIGDALAKLVTDLIALAEWLVKNKELVAGVASAMLILKASFEIGSLVKGLITSFIALSSALSGATAAQWGLNVAMDANPIGLVLAAVGGLIAIVNVLVSSIETAEEKAKNSASNYKAAENEIKSVTDKINDNLKKRNELLESGNANPQVLADLETENEFLRQKKILLEETAKIEHAESERNAAETINDKAYDYNAAMSTYYESIAEYEKAVNEGDTLWAEHYKDSADASLQEARDILTNLSDTAELIDGATEEGKAAQGLYTVWMTELNKLSGAVTETTAAIETMNEVAFTTTADRVHEFANASETAWEDYIETQKQWLNIGFIDEETYYKRLQFTLEKNNVSRLGETNSYWSELYNFNKQKQSEAESQQKKYLDERTKNEKAALDKSEKAFKSSFEAVTKEYKDAAEQIESEQNTLSENLSDAAMFARKTIGDNSEIEKKLNEQLELGLISRAKYDEQMRNQTKDNDILVLTNFDEKYQELEAYDELLEKIKSAGAGDDMLSEIMGMGVSDAIEYMETLLKSDTLDEYIKSYEQYLKKAKDIAKNEYADEAEALQEDVKSRIVSVMAEMPNVARQQGYDAALEFLDGLKQGLGNENAYMAVAANSSIYASSGAAQSGLDMRVQTGGEKQPVTIEITLDGKTISQSVINDINAANYIQGKSVIE